MKKNPDLERFTKQLNLDTKCIKKRFYSNINLFPCKFI